VTDQRKIYVASSWRNAVQPDVVAALQSDGHLVYDFRNPRDGDTGFHWSRLDPNWKAWSPQEFRAQLEGHPVAADGFKSDRAALDWCDLCVLVMPCGRSAHLEFGYAIGAGKASVIMLSDGEPELMYLFADFRCIGIDEVREAVKSLASGRAA